MHFLFTAVLVFGQASATPNSFIQTTNRKKPGLFSLQTGAHRLTAPGRPDVWLVGAAHIGSRDYYTALQALLDAQGEVLFEGVKPSAKQRPTPTPVQAPVNPPPQRSKPPKPVYQVLSDALGLDFQMADINYAQPNWVDSDLSIDDLDKLNRAASPDKPTGFDGIKAMLDPTSPTASLMSGQISQMTPGMREGFKLFFVKYISTLEPGAGLADATTAEVVLHARNKAVESYFDKVIGVPQPPFSVAIFYGAMHQPAIEADLAKQYGYKVVESRWFTAATADTKKLDAPGQMMYDTLAKQFTAPKAAPKK